MTVAKFARRAVTAMAALAGAGLVAGAAHADQVYFANGLGGAVKLSVDAQPVGDLPSYSASTMPLAPGEHAIAFVTEDGSSVSKVFELEEADLAPAHNDRFWCFFVIPHNPGSVFGALVQLPTAACKSAVTGES